MKNEKNESQDDSKAGATLRDEIICDEFGVVDDGVKRWKPFAYSARATFESLRYRGDIITIEVEETPIAEGWRVEDVLNEVLYGVIKSGEIDELCNGAVYLKLHQGCGDCILREYNMVFLYTTVINCFGEYEGHWTRSHDTASKHFGKTWKDIESSLYSEIEKATNNFVKTMRAILNHMKSTHKDYMYGDAIFFKGSSELNSDCTFPDRFVATFDYNLDDGNKFFKLILAAVEHFAKVRNDDEFDYYDHRYVKYRCGDYDDMSISFYVNKCGEIKVNCHFIGFEELNKQYEYEDFLNAVVDCVIHYYSFKSDNSKTDSLETKSVKDEEIDKTFNFDSTSTENVDEDSDSDCEKLLIEFFAKLLSNFK
jgi:hypothetical protein